MSSQFQQAQGCIHDIRMKLWKLDVVLDTYRSIQLNDNNLKEKRLNFKSIVNGEDLINDRFVNEEFLICKSFFL